MPLDLKYFVLKPAGESLFAVASRNAMLRYAETIEPSDEIFAEELRHWVSVEAARSKVKQNPEPDYKTLYYDILLQVSDVVPGESRHETAKRLIQQSESSLGEEVQKSSLSGEMADTGDSKSSDG